MSRPTSRIQANDHNDMLLLKVDAAARQLSIGRTTLYQLMDQGLIWYVHVGRNRRVVAASLAEYVNTLLERAKTAEREW